VSYSTKDQDEWLRRATAAAVAAARDLVLKGAVIPMGTPIGRLNDHEWGWAFSAMLFAWIKTRAQQAADEGLDAEQTIRLTGMVPDPWDAGAVAAILPKLAQLEIDWKLRVIEWSQDTMVKFLLAAFGLIRQAEIARDFASPVLRQSAHVAARQANAAAGNGLLAPDELNDPLPI
jgi:hypothetical protein